jgi:hypothetical protein
MDDLSKFRAFFRQKYAHLGLPDTDEGLEIAARQWITEQEQGAEQAKENMARIMALLDAKAAELEQAEVIARKSTREFKPGNDANPEKYDSSIYLPILDKFLAAGVTAEQAYLETAEHYHANHKPQADVLKLKAAIKKKDQRRQK